MEWFLGAIRLALLDTYGLIWGIELDAIEMHMEGFDLLQA